MIGAHALQLAYGEGRGTSSSGEDVITAGTNGYRVYFARAGMTLLTCRSMVRAPN
ncbi:hypothetical protein [Undibacterium sp. TS12]|uniref:hypothetical protein n=1 Tax=Undibacterium sp. TS12 TaxID=2908202 RepID=UPI001F4C5A4B|nr:hypothetical protein [Undibacterium sp. TS12]MCH8622460.1 hypothetical protein [Undibacterium sp. TS12]